MAIRLASTTKIEEAIWHLKDLYLLFPKMLVLESNHGSLVYRKGKHHGIPRSVFKSYNEILEAPKYWSWHFELTINTPLGKVYFHHGHSKNSLKNSHEKSMNYVQGHHHGTMDIQYWANTEGLFWGSTAGCLIDYKRLAFAYAKNNIKKPLLGCLMIINGVPKLIPMILNKKGRWIKQII